MSGLPILLKFLIADFLSKDWLIALLGLRERGLSAV